MTFSTRIIGAIGALLVALVLIAGWFLGVSPLLAKAAEAGAARAEVLMQNEMLAAKVAEMKKQFEEIEVYEEQLEALHTFIPDIYDGGYFIAALERCAVDSGAGQLSGFEQKSATAYLAPAGVDDVIMAPGPSLAAKLHRIEVSVKLKFSSFTGAAGYLHCLQSHETRLFSVTSAEMKDTGELEIYGFVYSATDPAQVQSRLDEGPYPAEDAATGGETSEEGEAEETAP